MPTAIPWEWVLVSESAQKSKAFPAVLPANANDYGGRYHYDAEEPLIVRSFRAEGVIPTELNAIRTAFNSRTAKYSLTDKLGDNYQGYITGYNFEYTDGTDAYHNVDLEMTFVTTEL